MAKKGGPESSMGLMHFVALGAGFCIVLMAALWHFEQRAIVVAVMHYCYWIVWPWAKLADLIGWNSAPPIKTIRSIVEVASRSDEAAPGLLLVALNKAGLYTLPLLYFPVAAGFAAMRHPYVKCRTIHNTWSLIEAQAKFNPNIVPVVRFENYWKKGNPRNKNITRAVQPDEFAKKHGLVNESGAELSLNIEKTAELFSRQVGEKFNPSKVPSYYKSLAGVFMVRICERSESGRKKAKEILDSINLSCDPEKKLSFDFSFGKKEFSEYLKKKEIREILAAHPYSTTFLIALLREARKDGKIPCSDFIWLKMLNRPLFYALNAVSPEVIASAMTEAAGPWAQYLSELTAQESGMYLEEIHIDEAIPAFEQRLFELGTITRRHFFNS